MNIRSSSPPPPARPLIWLVDDSPQQAEYSRSILAREAEVVVFTDGATVLERFGADRRPDVVVLDWHMPDISGVEVCRFMRASANSAELPILILTATAENESLCEAFRAGANDFVRKPFPVAELEARVSALIRSKRDHERLAEIEQRLRVEADYREKFIGMLAHDLRQPVSTFMLANQTIRQATTQDAREKYLDMQVRATKRMSAMITDLLDFALSRPKDGIPIDRNPIDLRDVLERVVAEMRVAHPTRTFTLTSEGVSSGEWDADRTAQMCSNLVSNAVQHGSSDHPIQIALNGFADHIELRVTNRGAAIAADLLPNIFEPFRRGRSKVKRGESVGLGLYIVDQIAKAHGGGVQVVSDEAGTVFEVTLPRS